VNKNNSHKNEEREERRGEEGASES